jgi:hypothetical protein
VIVPDIEGDQGYPPVPQLSNDEVKTLKNFTIETMKTALRK